MKLSEVIERMKNEYEYNVDQDYRDMEQEDIDNGNDRRAMYWRGIRKGWDEAICYLEYLHEDMGMK